MSEAIIDALRRKYMENIGNPAAQLVGGAVRGYFGLDAPEYADGLGMEAYRNAQALGNAPGIGAPAGAFKAMAAAPLMVKALRNAPRSEALETARQNAVKMLGLPENNTAMDRARALGFHGEGFHATGADIRQIDPEKIALSDYGTIGQGFYIDPSKRAGYSNLVARINQNKAPQNIIPVKYKTDNLYDMTGLIGPTSSEASKRLTANMKEAGYSGTFTSLPDGSINEVAVFNPSIVRSRFAAFDPARVNENDLLGRADPRLLGLIAAGTATGATVAALRNKKEDDKKKKDEK